MSESEHATEVFISVDIEAAGPIPGIYSMLSLGACVVGAPSATFYREFQPISSNAIPAALEVSRFSLERLAEIGNDPAEAMGAFRVWVEEVSAGRNPVCVGFNASFDWAFVNWYFHTFLGENPLGIGAVDIKAYYMGLVGCAWADTTSSRLPRRFQSTHQQTHKALDDAIAQADIFHKLLHEPRYRERTAMPETGPES